jgi:threonine dehydrogenase-like Zn-dependent dehydrogenase
MRGLVISRGTVTVTRDLSSPAPSPGEVRVRVLRAGICATDLALRRGYMGFEGIPGHEFVGQALEGQFAGRRVVGEINVGCGECDACRGDLDRHCPKRTVLGILGRSGAFADEVLLPARNLHPVPDAISTDAAVFTEPLAAAFEIAEQVRLEPGRRALVAGDGKLGILCAWVLHLLGLRVTVAGRHPERNELLPAETQHHVGWLEEDVRWHSFEPSHPPFDLAVEATGRPEALARLVPRVRPRGTIVLKTTAETPGVFDTSPAVVNELTLVGSRCGRFAPALDALARGLVPVERLVTARYPLERGASAFERADRPGALKVLLDVS